MFSLCPLLRGVLHPADQRGVPLSLLTGGTPILPGGEVTPVNPNRRYPHFSRQRVVPPSGPTGVYPGVPPSGLDGVPPFKTGWGTIPSLSGLDGVTLPPPQHCSYHFVITPPPPSLRFQSHCFVSSPFDLSNVVCKQHHRTLLNPFLNGTKNGNIDVTYKLSFTEHYGVNWCMKEICFVQYLFSVTCLWFPNTTISVFAHNIEDLFHNKRAMTSR